MKTTLKIGILLVALILAVGGIMIYAKTKVNPPTTPKQIDVYSSDLAQCKISLRNASKKESVDSVFFTIIDRIRIYSQEGKIRDAVTNKELDDAVGIYMPMYLRRCFEKFEQSVWYDSDHARMLVEIADLRKIKHSDNTNVIDNSTQDSLNIIIQTINRYKQARRISKSTRFTGVSNAQSVISQARLLANDKYLSNCTDLKNALNSVRSEIAQSHYRYISAQVEKLSQYRYFGQSYYDNTLVPQVDAAVTEYDNKAVALYGKKQNVEPLWARARGYYDQASSYYNN
jgi:hypothetical protein